MQSPLGANGVSYLYIGQSHILPVLAEGGVFVNRHDLRLLVASPFYGDFELMDSGHFTHHPGFSEGGPGVADLLSIDIDHKNGTHCLGLGVNYSAGHQHVANMNIGGLNGLPILHQASVGAVENLVGFPLVGADGKAAGCGRGDGSANSIPPAKSSPHAVAAVGSIPVLGRAKRHCDHGHS